MRKTPVRIRGQDYPSMTEAARALGVSITTVWEGIEAGRPDSIGTGQKKRPKPVTYAGVEYPSISALARAYGLSHQQVSDRLRRGLDPVTGQQS